MLRMVHERETIQHIRSKVDIHDKHQWLDEATTTSMPSDTTVPRISLCSQGKHLTAGAYCAILSEDLGISDFATSISNLFQNRTRPNARLGQVSF
jgi:hypothetical protein